MPTNRPKTLGNSRVGPGNATAVSVAEQALGHGDVGGYLLFQCVDSWKAPLFAQPRDELHAHGPAVDVLREVEEVHFQRERCSAGSSGQRTVVAKGRIQAEIGGAAERFLRVSHSVCRIGEQTR